MTFRYPNTISLPSVIASSRRRLAIITDNVGLPNGSGAQWVGVNASSSAFYLQNWWIWALGILDWPYELVAISSGATRTCAQAASAFAAEVTAFGPQEIWICLGRNDMTSAATATAALGQIDAIIAAALVINPSMPIKISTVIPGNATTQVTAYQQASTTFNYGIRRRAEINPTVQVIDMAAVVRDPAQANGQALSGYIGGDNINPTPQTHMLMGTYWAGNISSVPVTTIRPMGAQDYFGTNVNSKQLVQNPTFNGSAGVIRGGSTGVTGTIPTGWGVGCGNGVTAALGAVTTDTTPYPRTWLPITVGGTATAATTIGLSPTMPASPNIVTLGTSLVRARVGIKTTNLTGVAAIVLYLITFDSGFGVTSNAQMATQVGTGQTSFPSSFHLEIPAAVMTPLTAVNWQMTIELDINNGASPTGSFAFSTPIVEVVV